MILDLFLLNGLVSRRVRGARMRSLVVHDFLALILLERGMRRVSFRLSILGCLSSLLIFVEASSAMVSFLGRRSSSSR